MLSCPLNHTPCVILKRHFNYYMIIVIYVSLFRVSFDATHSLHILCYNDHLYAFSNEISSWFWESDLLQYRLHKIPCSPCNQLIYDNKAPSVFEQLKKLNDPVFMASIKKGQISVYPLEE